MPAPQTRPPPTTANLPAYRLRRGYSQAIVTLTDSATGKRKDYWLGEYGSPVKREMYHRVLSQWESLGRRLPPAGTLVLPPSSNGALSSLHPGPVPVTALTISGLINTYRQHIEATFKPPTRATIYMVLQLLDQFFGSTAAEEFGPNKLRLLREQMIKGSPESDPPRKSWSRTTVNKAVHQVGAMFRWAASHEMLPVTLHVQLKTLAALRRGQSAAAESDPVQPVPIATVEATKPFLSCQVRALVELQLLTGARGGELLQLRPMDLIRQVPGSTVWMIKPRDHKTAHHGHERTLYLGPKAQRVLEPFLNGRKLGDFLFSPAEAERERREAATAKRKTRRGQGNGPGTNRAKMPKRSPGDYFTAAAYRNAIGCRPVLSNKRI
jgi:hypothetical protein